VDERTQRYGVRHDDLSVILPRMVRATRRTNLPEVQHPNRTHAADLHGSGAPGECRMMLFMQNRKNTPNKLSRLIRDLRAKQKRIATAREVFGDDGCLSDVELVQMTRPKKRQRDRERQVRTTDSQDPESSPKNRG
jgi:hypothetical protein